jgi:hypothetical protein
MDNFFPLRYLLCGKEERIAKRAKKKRGPKPKYFDNTCPNPKCKHQGKKDQGNVVSNGTY